MLQWGRGSHSSPPRICMTLWLVGVVLGDFSRSFSEGRGPTGPSFPEEGWQLQGAAHCLETAGEKRAELSQRAPARAFPVSNKESA